MEDRKHTCNICEVEFLGWGNNPEPLVTAEQRAATDPRCCNDCNDRFVIPARLMGIDREDVIEFLMRVAMLGRGFAATRKWTTDPKNQELLKSLAVKADG